MKASDRIITAMMQGWSIGPIITRTSSGRVSMWASQQISSGWKCHKVEPTGDIEVDLSALLDEAGVPKYE